MGISKKKIEKTKENILFFFHFLKRKIRPEEKENHQ